MVIFGMGAENRSRKQEFQLRVGVGFCVFLGVGIQELQGESSRIRYFNIFTRLII